MHSSGRRIFVVAFARHVALENGMCILFLAVALFAASEKRWEWMLLME